MNFSFFINIALLIAATIALASGASIISKETKGVTYCQNRTPCAWAVYLPFTRRIDYMMKNTCECPAGKSCMRTDDDLSVSAYVYRCQDSNYSDPTTPS